MRITEAGWAVANSDTHLSKWIEETGLIDHGQHLREHYIELGMRPGDTVIDIGACLGDTTVPMAEAVGPEGRVYAFEPNPEPFACLMYNTHRYPQVRCFPLALGCSPVDQIVHLMPHDNIGASHLNHPDGGKPVVLTTLDKFEISGVRFIKMDVEGGELAVLAGAERTIGVCRPTLKIETAVHAARFGTTRQELYRWLEHSGYVCEPEEKDLEEHPQYDIIAKPNDLCLTNHTEPRTT
jgi:FkbM family methyltransferase